MIKRGSELLPSKVPEKKYTTERKDTPGFLINISHLAILN